MNTLQKATEYLQMGYSVIPLKPGHKRPLVKWSAYTESRPTANDLTEWFGSGDDKNIAIITGPVSGLVVVDIDDPGLLDRYLRNYPTDRIVKTPGGYHLYYRYGGSDIGNSVSKLATGVDVRGNKGYVLAPPSRTYGEYKWLRSGSPAPLPTALRQEILNGLYAQQQETPQPPAPQDANDLYRQIQLEGFTPHRHNEQVKDLARYLYRQGVTNEAAIVRLISPLNEKDPTPLTATEMRDTIRSAMKYERNRLEGQGDDSPVVFDAKTFDEVDQQYDDVFSHWLIDQWVPLKSILMIAAPPESYKTWLLLDAAISVALGKDASPFLGYYKMHGEGVPVLIIQQEDYMGQLMVRMRAIGDARGADITYPVYFYDETRRTGEVDAWGQPVEVPTGNRSVAFGTAYGTLAKNVFIHTTSSLAFDNEASLDALEAKIKEHGIRLVVIDPLYMLDTAEDNFASVARKMSRIKAMRDAYDCTFIFAHHTRKSGGNGRDAIFGSQLLNGSLEGVWLIKETNDPEYRRIERYGKAFQGHQQALRARFEIDTDGLSEKITPKGPQREVAVPYRVEVEPDTGDDDGVTSSELEEQVLEFMRVRINARPSDFYNEFDVSPDKTKRAFRSLADKGLLLKAESTKGRYIYPSEKSADI